MDKVDSNGETNYKVSHETALKCQQLHLISKLNEISFIWVKGVILSHFYH